MTVLHKHLISINRAKSRADLLDVLADVIIDWSQGILIVEEKDLLTDIIAKIGIYYKYKEINENEENL